MTRRSLAPFRRRLVPAVLAAWMLGGGQVVGATAPVVSPLQEPSLPDDLAREVASFERDWREALEVYEAELASAGGRPPIHPAARFLERMEELVALGHADGEVWLLAHLDDLRLPPGARRERRAELVSTLLERELAGPPVAAEDGTVAPHPELELALRHLARCTFDVERGEGEELARTALRETADPAVKAAALLALAQYACAAGTSTDPAHWREADELLDKLVRDFGETPAAELGAPILCELMGKRYELEREDWWAEWASSTEPPDPQSHPAVVWWPRFEALSDRGIGEALWWLILNAEHGTSTDEERRELRLSLFDRVVAEHADADWLVGAVQSSSSMVDELSIEAVTGLGARLLEASTNPEVRAWTMYELASLAARDEADDVRVERAIDLLERLLEEHPGHRLAPDARAKAFALRNLRIGQVVPEVVLPPGDEGVEVRLSDYRGRVTLIVFWGFWINGDAGLGEALAPLLAANPRERLTVLGVNTDKNVDAARESAREAGLGWDHHFVGGPAAPWPASWRIHRYPTTILLDEQGRIRAKGIVGDELVAAIEALLRGDGDSGVEESVPPDPQRE